MRTKDKGKMCPYCEGTVSMDAQECKYCGSSFMKKAAATSAYQTEDSLASLYEPPYAPSRKSSVYGIPEQEASQTSGMHESIHDPIHDPLEGQFEEQVAPPLRSPQKPKRTPRKTAVKRKSSTDVDEEDEESLQIGSLLFLSLGGHLFTLAWLLFFFSDHGKLVLEWKSRYWVVYLLISLPLLYKGWKKLTDSS